jgi:hypothetical protein
MLSRRHSPILPLVAVPAAALALALPAAAQPPPPPAGADAADTADLADGASLSEETRIAAGGSGMRPFNSTSYWNTPLGKAPIDKHSRKYIRDSQNPGHTQNYLKLVMGDWGMPYYRSNAKHPAYRIVPGSGPTIRRVHIPRAARPMPTDDAALIVVDSATRQVVSLQGARYNRSKNRWSASGASRYWLHSNGIHEDLPGGTNGNEGHRGLPGSIRAVTKAEVMRGAIRHRLEVYWWETAERTPEGRETYFPMTGSESGNNGVVPEGIVIRIRPSVDLEAKNLSRAAYVVARALQRYGAVVGDNAGGGNSLKVQANADWRGLLHKNSLRSIKWSDYVFVKGGYRP